MISLQQVSKHFAGRPAVESLSLDVPRGRIFGLLGHNGAGKSTAIGMVLGQVFPNHGKIHINGHDVFKERRQALSRVGAIFEAPAFYNYLSGMTNLRIFCQYTATPDEARLKEIVRLVGLESRINDRVKTYSHGMRQRLALAQALLPNPELLILDEPSEGLDPEGIHEMRNLILKLNREWELTILFSSHLLSEVQQLCSNLAVLNQGKLIFTGEWRQTNAQQQWVKIAADRQADAEAGLVKEGFIGTFTEDGHGQLAPGRSAADVADWLVARGFRVHALVPTERTLEDFYLEMVRSQQGQRKTGASA